MAVRVAVVGSLVLDHVVRVERFPRPGESVAARDFATFPGGKGANQAVAAARLGASVAFTGRIGRDPAGAVLRAALVDAGVDVTELRECDSPSGAALITLDPSGQNCICVALGANEELRDAPDLHADAVLAQLETAPSASLSAMRSDCPVRILNPAPPREMPEEIWSLANVATPNEHEASFYAGFDVTDIETARRAVDWFHSRGTERVAITLGSAGVYASENGIGHLVSGRSVKVVDTVGAGDAFNGALAVRLASGDGFFEACAYACASATLSVTRAGAQTGLPTAEEVQTFLSASA